MVCPGASSGSATHPLNLWMCLVRGFNDSPTGIPARGDQQGGKTFTPSILWSPIRRGEYALRVVGSNAQEHQTNSDSCCGPWLGACRQSWSFERSQRKTHLEAQVDQLLALQCAVFVRYHLWNPTRPPYSSRRQSNLSSGLCTRERVGSQACRCSPDSILRWPQKQFYLNWSPQLDPIMVGCGQACSLFLAPQANCVQQRSCCGRSTF